MDLGNDSGARRGDAAFHQQLGAMAQQLESISEVVARIEYSLNGNGDGKPGLKTRIDRLEEWRKRQSGIVNWLAGLFTALAAAITTYFVEGP